MLRWSNPAHGFVLAVLLLVGFVVPTTAVAGNTHSEGGPVLEAAGTPETDGAQAITYWAGDSSTRATTTVGAVLSGHWLQDVGFNLAREWQVGDDHISVIELETNATQTTHKGYYGVINKTLTSLDPDEYPVMTVRAIPMPVATAGAGFIDLAWSAAAQDAGSPAMNNIAGYRVFRSTDGKTFAAVTDSLFTSLAFRDTGVVFGTTYYYALQLAYRGTPAYRGSKLSGNSNPASPLDVVPPDVPVLAGEPAFTPGTTNTITWSDESASGAIAYQAQAALDSAFANIAASSNWIATTSHEFTGLQDRQTYYYRVRARDLGLNESTMSLRVASTQDASAPATTVDVLPTYTSTPTFDIPWSGTDAASGVATVDLYYAKDGAAFTLLPGFTTNPIAFNASLLGDGTFVFYTIGHDAVGNLEAAPAVPDAQTTIDTSAPGAPSIAALPLFTPGSQFTLSWSDEAASGAAAYRAETSTAADFSSIAMATDWISAHEFAFTGLADGQTYYFRVQARDAAENPTGYSGAQSTTMDATAPASSAANPSLVDGLQYEIAWSATDAGSGLQHVALWYSHNGATFVAHPGGPFTTSPILFDAALSGGEGSYAFYTVAQDQVGNTETAPATPDATLITDSVGPNAPTLAALPAYELDTTLDLSWSNESASGAVEYRAQTSISADFASIAFQSDWIAATQHTFDAVVDGSTYYLRVLARDAAFNETASASAQVTIDASAPTSAVAPLAANNSSTFGIAWSGTDATSGIAFVELYFSRDGADFAPYPGGPFTASPIAFDALQVGGDGSYAFYTIATDRAGNVEAAPAQADASTTIDTQAPAIPMMLAEPAATPGDENTVAWDAVAAATAYNAQCGLDAMFMNVIATSGWIQATSHTFTGLEAGVTYYYRVRSRDASNNVSTYSQPVWSTQNLGRVLTQGWNLISFDVTPENPRIDRVLSPIAGSFSIVRSYEDGQFNSYLPTMPVEMNDLQQMDPRNAYWIYMTRQDTLAVKGTALPDNTPIALRAGWELVSYLPDDVQAADVALGSIRESLVLARGYDQGYQSYYPALGSLSNLETLRPGFGYWLYMGQDDELVYGQMATAGLETASRATQQAVSSKSSGSVVPTVMDLWSLEIQLDGAPAPAGCTLEAYDAANNRIGSTKLGQDGVMLLHVPGDVSITAADEGALPGEAITLRLKTAQGTFDLDTQIVFEADAAKEATIDAALADQLPRAFSLAQNHPNPFNPSTRIAYAIPADVDAKGTQVRLQVFDIRGRVVRTLVNTKQSAGRYAVQWDGSDDAGQPVSSGVYFYRLQTAQFSQTHKMMMLK